MLISFVIRLVISNKSGLYFHPPITMINSKKIIKDKLGVKDIEHIRSSAFNYDKDVYENKQSQMNFNF